MTDPVQAVRRYPLFAALDPGWVEGWVRTAALRTIPAGTTLARENDHGAHVFLVDAGIIRVQRRDRGGRDRTMGDAGPGELLGDYALLPPGTFPATLRAVVPSRVRCLPLDPLRAAASCRSGVAHTLRAWLRLHYAVRYQAAEVFLGFMSAPSFLHLLDEQNPVKVPAGRQLPANNWFWVLTGRVVIRAPRTAPVSISAGEWFGLEALLGQHQTSDAVTASDVEVLALTRKRFLDGGTERAASRHSANALKAHSV